MGSVWRVRELGILSPKRVPPSGPSPWGSENPAERSEEPEEWRIQRKQGLVNAAGLMLL